MVSIKGSLRAGAGEEESEYEESPGRGTETECWARGGLKSLAVEAA